jgi:hypothetical protein
MINSSAFYCIALKVFAKTFIAHRKISRALFLLATNCLFFSGLNPLFAKS